MISDLRKNAGHECWSSSVLKWVFVCVKNPEKTKTKSKHLCRKYTASKTCLAIYTTNYVKIITFLWMIWKPIHLLFFLWLEVYSMVKAMLVFISQILQLFFTLGKTEAIFDFQMTINFNTFNGVWCIWFLNILNLKTEEVYINFIVHYNILQSFITKSNNRSN